MTTRNSSHAQMLASIASQVVEQHRNAGHVHTWEAGTTCHYMWLWSNRTPRGLRVLAAHPAGKVSVMSWHVINGPGLWVEAIYKSSSDHGAIFEDTKGRTIALSGGSSKLRRSHKISACEGNHEIGAIA